VHIEFVYGGLSILPKRECGVGKATLGLCVIIVAMLALSLVRTHYKGRGKRERSETLPITVQQSA
jgi:hypothetical protein